MPEVVAVGAMMIDLITYLPEEVPNFGESMNVDKCVLAFGGKGANQAAMACLLGAETAFIGRVGADVFGTNYLDHFAQIGVDTSSVGVSTVQRTGVAQIMVSKVDGQSAIAAYFGANLELSVEDIRKAEAQIASAKCLVISFENSLSTILEALRIAKRHGVTTIVNPAPRRVAAQLRASSIEFDELFQLVDILCPNESEAAALIGEPFPVGEETDEAVRTRATRAVERLHAELHRNGNVNALAISTMGERGVAFWNSETNQVKFIEVQRVQVLDATGASDSLIGSLAYFVVRHPALPIEEKIRRAAYIATVSVTNHGTQDSYPKRHDLPSELFY